MLLEPTETRPFLFYMPPVPPYPFRTVTGCKCHKPCSDRHPTGRYAWALASQATLSLAFLRVPRKLTEYEAGGNSCAWRVVLEDPPGSGLTTELELVLNVGASGVGYPGNWLFRAQHFYSACFSWFELTLPFTEQFDCREIPEFEEVPLIFTSCPLSPQPLIHTVRVRWGWENYSPWA